MSLDIDNTDLSLPAILSRIPAQSPPLPTELILTLLTPLLTPHKESRDHHLLITSNSPSPTAKLIRNVHFPSSCFPVLMTVDYQFTRFEDDRYVCDGEDVPFGSCQGS